MQPTIISRDKINFFHFIDQVYPSRIITESKSRLLLDMFSGKRNYIVLKVGDVRHLDAIVDIQVSLIKVQSMLFLKTRFLAADETKNFFSTIPVNAKRGASNVTYPENGQDLDLEFHFLDHFSHEKLAKVLRVTVTDQDFIATLVNHYQAQLESEIDDETFEIDTKLFLCLPEKRHGEYVIAISTDSVITKALPESNETEFLDS
ncbi:hypothetical protein [Vibrio sp. Hal054]|uniref:hypothetical protein n=1 Tax=Vibrio sp. Hal054 TaxID=3035158 RepID=UPI00301CD325